MSVGAANLRHFILGLLSRQPMSGYDIKRFLKSLNWLIGNPSFGSLYPALHALLRDDLVTVETHSRENKPPRKIYSITEAGKEVLKKWIEQPVKPGAPLKVFMMRLILADNYSTAGLIAHLEQRRVQVAAHQDAIQQMLLAPDEKVNPEQHLALDYGLALANAELAWLEHTLNQLSQST